LRDWEDEVGIESDGVAQLGQFAVIEAGSRVTETFLDRGDAVSTGSVLFETGISRRELTGTIDTADDRLVVEGAEVTVEFSDGATTTGTVRSVSSPIIQNGADGATSVTPFAITVGEIPEKFADRTSVPVTVSLVAELAQGAVVVPASALMSTGDGGYAVEAVTDTGTQMVAVDPGLFADGLVQVDGIAAGTAVVVPS
jgi:hypothetical protein